MQHNKGNAVTWVLILLVLAGIAWWMMSIRDNNALDTDDTATTTTDSLNATGTVSLEGDMVDEIIITYTDAGFSPAEVTINKGQTVRWVNQSSGDMWVGSAMHPTHEVYSGTTLAQHCEPGDPNDSLDQCANGEVYEFTFDKVGQWGYHNHSRANHFGRVIVQ